MLNLNDLTQPAEELADDVKNLAEQQKDIFLLKSVKGLSVVLARMFTITILFFVFMGMLIAVSFGATMILGEILGSYMIGSLVVAGLWVLLFCLLFAMRKKLFVNSFVRLFIYAIYGDK